MEGKTEPEVAVRVPVKLDLEEIADEHEEAVRDLKDQQNKKKKEDQARLQQVEQQAQEETKALAQTKAVDKGKPCTFDSEGNLIFMQPVQAERLPQLNPQIKYNFGKDSLPRPNSEATSPKGKAGAKKKSARGSPRPGTKGTQKGTQRGEPGFTDSYEKLTTLQPSAIETMDVQAGVSLMEGGRTKNGAQIEVKTMSRKQYSEIVDNDGGFACGEPSVEDGPCSQETSFAENPMASRSPGDDSNLQSRRPSQVAGSDKMNKIGGALSFDGNQSDVFNVGILQNPEWGKNPAKQDSRHQASAPATAHDPHLHYDAFRGEKVFFYFYE